jgi:uncharacterized membrane protein
MTFDRLLAFIVVGMTALLIGGMVGLWVGARSEQNTFLSMLARGKFTDDCKQQIRQALQSGEQHQP